ncbi:tRNA epoxyqueuosine(34) reductase QueG [Kaistia dalseonensis]|uniref:Epoxyqueuosine reductase n=1 Tax=Kaistia dalseonensis TaxID=410840 RepID=A0ABU0H7H4_9HYPH|nr:tRNA epoxyqueuosine(34) reductase QueG [Kaistia dalseonensis]MCX5494878.1 tRNA epoxyqueuosine(34) reductase QueG [Kaistia dalseonensis]MDQ0437459.1 epoxyqueuosine reductase [Kaistia dalseonensis]
MVCAGEVAPVLPPAAERRAPGRAGGDPLRRPGLLSPPALDKEKSRLVADAKAEGFDVVRIAAPDGIPLAPARLRQFLDDGHHASMGWMAETAERRADPRVLWPDVRSIVMLGLNYGPDADPRGLQARKDRGAISVYARNRDYHDIIKGKLKLLAGRLAARTGAEVKVFVDTAPVMEKPLAEAAGLGWQGKHTNLVSREFGSWLFLGAIFTALELPLDAPERDHCGSCRACLDACPTQAIPAPYRLDARRCISYLTIEHAGPIPAAFRAAMGNRIYGCDDCLAACPWNKFAQAASEMKLKSRPELEAPRLADLAALDDSGFRALFAGSPIKRIGRDRFVRNVLIAIGNSADAALLPSVLALLDDPAPIVRGAAVWAVSRLDPTEWAAQKTARHASEPDPETRKEWVA